jgi:small-conductance mechanosensitive channel
MNWEWLSIKTLTDFGTLPGALALAVAVIILATVASKLLSRLVRRAKTVIDRFGRGVDETLLTYILKIKTLLIFVIAGLFYVGLVPGLKGLLATLLAGAGVTALVVGFAAKSTLANLVSGFFLAIYRPFRIGDMVTIEDEYGTVEDITLRHTVVRTWEHKRLIIPNEKIDAATLINYSIIDPKMLCIVELGVSYDTEIDLARRLVLEEARNCPYRMQHAEDPWVRVIGHNDFSIGLRLYMWVPNVDNSYLAKWWLLEYIKKRFDREGVEIPFPYRTVVFKKDLPPPSKNEPGPGGPDGS